MSREDPGFAIATASEFCGVSGLHKVWVFTVPRPSKIPEFSKNSKSYEGSGSVLFIFL